MKDLHALDTTSAIETRDLRLVKAIAECGGVTHAAKSLHLSQSAASHQLAGLESRLGVRLFERVSRRMVITPAGRRLVEVASEVLPRLAVTEAELVRGGAGMRRTLRVSTQCYTCYHWFPGVLQRLSVAHPGLELQIVVEATRNPVDAMLEDRLDAALCCLPFKDRRLVGTRLFEDELVAVLPASHSLARRPYVTGRDLMKAPFFFYDLPPEDEKRLRRDLFGSKADAAPFKKVPLTEAIIELVRAGQGLTMLSRWSLGPHLARGDLVTRSIGAKGTRRSWSLVRPRSTTLAEPLETLSELLRSAMPIEG